MRGRTLLALGAAPLLLAQSQPTFYAAWEDGQEAERQGQWRAALAAYQRAAALRPVPAAQVIIYGNNLLKGYYPYTRMARCHLELGELEAAEAQLARAEGQGEPHREREALARRLREARAARQPAAPPPPKREEPAPKPLPAPVEPAVRPAPVAEPVPFAETAVPFAPPQAPVSAERPRVQAPRSVPAPAAVAPAPASLPPAPAAVPPSRIARSPWLTALELLAALAGVGFLALRWRSRPSGSHASAFENPERIGPYRLERLLGRGGFASTYLAHHEGGGQRVALKVLHPYRQDDPEFLGRFRQEARLGSLLDHPNLVRLVDPGPEQGTPWLAMEYVDGQRLDQYLREKGPLPLREALGFVRAIAAAMAHAHALGVVHRDLKPANVMLLDGQVKVMDFGIARTLDSETLTTTYAFLGTPLYAAPEAQLKTHVGPAADRYSLGVILFHMLAGVPPFQGETPFQILDGHRSAPAPRLDTLRPDVPAALVELVASLLEKEPSLRPEDEALLAGLEPWAGASVRPA